MGGLLFSKNLGRPFFIDMFLLSFYKMSQTYLYIRTIGLSSPEFTHVETHPLLCEESQEQVVSMNREKNVGH